MRDKLKPVATPVSPRDVQMELALLHARIDDLEYRNRLSSNESDVFRRARDWAACEAQEEE